MAKTYYMTDETKRVDGREVHRIVATEGNKWAAPGTIGGWIESENNLEDGAWIADNACVYGDARVYGNALVEDDAKVYGDAHFHGTESAPAILSLDRFLHGGDWTESPYTLPCGSWTAQMTSPDTFRIGCQDYSLDKWRKRYRAIMRYGVWHALGNEGIISEGIIAYNSSCYMYNRREYMVDPDEVMAAYKAMKKNHFAYEASSDTETFTP